MHSKQLNEVRQEPVRPKGEALRATVILARDGKTPADSVKAPAPDFPLPEVGTVLGRYRLLAWSGVGSAGVVFRGLHMALDVPVAVKILYRDRYPDRLAATEHLRTEAFLLARITHPHIVRLWDFHDDPELPYLVTEYVPGPTLGEVIRKEGKLEPHQAVRVVMQAADALGAVWRFGAIHRDLKPDNLILGPEAGVKLIDFGLAKIVAEESRPAPIAATVAEWAGTPAYLAPEQSRFGALVDHRADIYSLGVTFYEALTGRLPFRGKTAAQMILRHREETPLPPSVFNPAIGSDLSKVVLRMLAKNPAQRFDSSESLRAALRAAAAKL